MDKSKSTRSSRKAALAGQAKTATKPLNANLLREHEAMSGTMNNLAALHQKMNASVDNGTDLTEIAPHVEAVTEKAAQNTTATTPVTISRGVPVIQTLPQLVELLEGASETLIVDVPLTLVKGSEENHRDFRLGFNDFVEAVPPLPLNWAQLTQEEYLEQAWGDVFPKLISSGKLREEDLDHEKEQIGSLFAQAKNIAELGVMDEPRCFITYNGLSGQPSFIELIYGERRIRSCNILALSQVRIKLDTTAGSYDVTPDVLFRRQAQRTAENSQSKELSTSEKIRGLLDLYNTYRNWKTPEVVNRMLVKDLAAVLGAHFSGLGSAAGAGRYIRIVRCPFVDIILDLCEQENYRLLQLNDIVKRAEELAIDLEQPLSEAHIYASAASLPARQLPFAKIPETLHAAVWPLCRVLLGHVTLNEYSDQPEKAKAGFDATQTAELVNPIEQAAALKGLPVSQKASPLQSTPTGSAPHDVDEPTPLSQAGVASTTTRAQAPSTNTTQAEPDQTTSAKRPDLRPKEVQLRLLQNAISVKKGSSYAEGHARIFGTQVLLTALTHKKLPKDVGNELIELNALRGKPNELDEFRLGLLPLIEKIGSLVEMLMPDSRRAHEMLLRLMESDNCAEELLTLIAEHKKENPNG